MLIGELEMCVYQWLSSKLTFCVNYSSNLIQSSVKIGDLINTTFDSHLKQGIEITKHEMTMSIPHFFFLFMNFGMYTSNEGDQHLF